MIEPISATVNNDPFLQRAIEYWLDTANELGYQPLFCELLITRGLILKYSIKNTHFEQGKDVVAVAPDGIAHAFQLKGGNINLARWRNEVKPEIEVLIETAIQHPDIDKNVNHVSYLVTNGEIEDNVRIDIVALNEKKWKDSPLIVWTRGDLLTGFQRMAEGVLPKDAITYKKLIDLIFADGAGLPDLSKVNDFLSEILKVDINEVPKEQRRRDIAAALVYATMIAGSHRKVSNHTSTVHIMVLLLSLIFFIADKYKLEDKYWIESYNIIWADILNTAKLLETEITTIGFDASFTNAFEVDIIPYRKHSAVNIIYPLKLSQLISGNEEWADVLRDEIVLKYESSILIWGEGALLPLIFLNLCTRNAIQDDVGRYNLIELAVKNILNFNGRSSKLRGLMPPYYEINFVLKIALGFADSEFTESFRLTSYFLKSCVEILVRGNDKNFIRDNWKEISFMHFEEFVPEDTNDYYLWRSSKGENRTTLVQKEKKWSDLVAEAQSFSGNDLPKLMKRFPAFLPFFLAVFPHRATSSTLGFLDSISKT